MTPIRVIKIGGSLLQRKDLLVDLRNWQASLANQKIDVWIVGGGTAVDEIRQRDRAQCLADSEAHWSSIDAMDANALRLASQMPEWIFTSEPKDILRAVDRLSIGQRTVFSGGSEADRL